MPSAASEGLNKLLLLQDHENIATIQLAVDYWAAKDLDIPRSYRSKARFPAKWYMLILVVGRAASPGKSLEKLHLTC